MSIVDGLLNALIPPLTALRVTEVRDNLLLITTLIAQAFSTLSVRRYCYQPQSSVDPPVS